MVWRQKKKGSRHVPKLNSPLPIPHPVIISTLIHNRDHILGGSTAFMIDLDSEEFIRAMQ